MTGPFRRLEGGWRFKPLAKTPARSGFQLSYDFSGKLFEKIGPLFSQITTTFVEAFVKRADQVYGKSHGEQIRVEVVYALPTKQELFIVKVAPGTTVRQAIEASGIVEKYPEIDLAKNKLGVRQADPSGCCAARPCGRRNLPAADR